MEKLKQIFIEKVSLQINKLNVNKLSIILDVKEGFDGKDVKLGTLTFKVKYDKGKFYSGELQLG
jgi:hypothetical protein